MRTLPTHLHWVDLASKKTCKKNMARCNKVFITTELLSNAVNDFGAEKSARYNRVLFVSSAPRTNNITFAFAVTFAWCNHPLSRCKYSL